MAITVVDGVGSRPKGAAAPGSRRHNIVQVTFDSSYPTGGYALTAAQCGLSVIDVVDPMGPTDATGTWLPVWVASTGKIKLLSALGTEVTSTTDVHTGSIYCNVWGV